MLEYYTRHPEVYRGAASPKTFFNKPLFWEGLDFINRRKRLDSMESFEVLMQLTEIDRDIRQGWSLPENLYSRISDPLEALMLREFEKALAELPNKFDALRMKVEGMSNEEISRRFGTNSNITRIRLSLSRNEIAQLTGKYLNSGPPRSRKRLKTGGRHVSSKQEGTRVPGIKINARGDDSKTILAEITVLSLVLGLLVAAMAVYSEDFPANYEHFMLDIGSGTGMGVWVAEGIHTRLFEKRYKETYLSQPKYKDPLNKLSPRIGDFGAKVSAYSRNLLANLKTRNIVAK